MVLDLLVATKPKLDDSNAAVRASLVVELHQVVSLAESFTEQRPRSNKNWIHLANTLDREGVCPVSIFNQIHVPCITALILPQALTCGTYLVWFAKRPRTTAVPLLRHVSCLLPVLVIQGTDRAHTRWTPNFKSGLPDFGSSRQVWNPNPE